MCTCQRVWRSTRIIKEAMTMQKSIVNKSGRNAQPTAAQAAAKPKRAKKARIWKLRFVNGDNKTSSKITKETSGVQLLNTKVEGATPIAISIEDIPDSARKKLAAIAVGGMARKIAQTAGDQDAAEVLQEFFTKIAADDFVTAMSKTGGSRGRPFDAQLYTDAMARFVKLVDGKQMSDADKAKYQEKVAAMQADVRRKYFAQFTKSAEFNRALAEVKVERARAAAKTDKAVNADLLTKMMDI